MNRMILLSLAVALWFAGAPNLDAAQDKAAAVDTTKTSDKSWLRKLGRWVRHIERIDAKLSKNDISPGRRDKLLLQREKSLSGLDAARGKNHDDFAAQIQMARAFLQVGESQRARLAAERAVELAPDDLESLAVQALARYKNGDHALASEDAKKVLKKDPTNLGARDILRLTAPTTKKE